jgi:glycosyltransferase involved in cell wall biosynthesis
MRIAHITDCYLPRTGGIERQVYGLSHAQSAAGHDVSVITSVPEDGAAVTGLGDERVHVIRPRAGAPATIRYASSTRGRDAAVTGGYDLLHVHASTFSPLAYLTARAAGRAGIPTLFTLHSLWSYATPIFRAADLPLGWRGWPLTWTAVSRTAAGSLQQVLGARTPVAVLPNAIDPDAWRVRPAHDRRTSTVVVASVMRLATRKRPLEYLAMLRSMRAQVPAEIAIEAIIVGDGPRRQAAERYLQRHRMTGWVRLVGHKTPGEIRDIFAASDFYVAPALLESFGIAALEARCAGLPVVAFARSGVADIIADGRSGLLVADDTAMTAAMVSLATNPLLRRRLAASARGADTTFSWDSVLRQCENLYDRTLNAPSRIGAPGADLARRLEQLTPAARL